MNTADKTAAELRAMAEALESIKDELRLRSAIYYVRKEIRALAAAAPLRDMTKADFDAAHHIADAGKMVAAPTPNVDEYHLRYPGMSEEWAQRIADKINYGWLDGSVSPHERIAALEAASADLIVQRDEALIAESKAITELAQVKAERDAAAADSERLEWALPILTGADSDDADKLAMKLALALMRGLDGRAAIDFARKEC